MSRKDFRTSLAAAPRVTKFAVWLDALRNNMVSARAGWSRAFRKKQVAISVALKGNETLETWIRSAVTVR